MKTSQHVLLATIILVLLANNLTAQDYKKNSVYINVGSVIWQSQFSIAGERTLFFNDKSRTRARLTLGSFTKNHFDSDDEAYQDQRLFGTVSIVHLVSVFELGLGAGANTYKWVAGNEEPVNPPEYYEKSRIGFQPHVNAGLRFGKQQFLFRLGVGYPEYLYLGMGANF